jgi:exonuclease VII large subunit
MTTALAQRLASGLSSHTTLGRERLARTTDRLTGAMSNLVENRKAVLHRLGVQLDALSPLKVARDVTGRVLKQTGDFTPGMDFRLTVSDGEVAARSVTKEPGNNGG